MTTRSGRIISFPHRRSVEGGLVADPATPPEWPGASVAYEVRLRRWTGPSQRADPLPHGFVGAKLAGAGFDWISASLPYPPEEELLHVLPGALLFDPAYYASQAGNVPWPRTHYMREGWRRGFDPHPLFCTDHYVGRLGRSLQRDPLFDFLVRGRFEGAEVHPLFCNGTYLALRPDVARAGVHPLVHYLEYGWREGVRGPCLWFDEDAYERQVPGLDAAGIIPVVHYLAYGWREGRTPSPQFDPGLMAKVGAVEADHEPLTRLLVELHSRPLLESARRPTTSVIVLNLNKPLLTISCLRALGANTDMSDVEVIVVDNGSSEAGFAMLARHATGVRLVRLRDNMGFGEANNIAVELARGENIVFLNNDAFVTPGWLEPLTRALEQEDVGAVGPMILYPDGMVQEAGAFLAVDGQAHQFGKGLSADFEPLNRAADVHYVSAAALMVRKALFEQVGGFDLCWDPAYYEDADLCLKLKLHGYRTVYSPEARVFHIEHATSSDSTLDLRLHDVVEVNRLKFIARWSAWLQNGATKPIGLLPPATRAPAAVRAACRRAILHTPYPLTPGGGERYLLTLAEALTTADYDVVLATSAPYSALRLRNLARDLDLDVSGVRLAHMADPAAYAGADLLVAMSNEALPPVAPFARVNVHHCQFPFPMHPGCLAERWAHAEGWDAALVNSAFTRDAYLRTLAALGLPAPPVHVLHPPAPQLAPSARRRPGEVVRILNVGRFFRSGHCKRQDLLVGAFRRLMTRAGERRIELHLVGAVGSDPQDREYLNLVRRLAQGLPVRFHINVQPGQLADIYADADMYWHATGLGENVSTHPERFEHFGISVVEAMSAGAAPFVLDAAGPAEVVRHGQDGFRYSDADELVELSLAFLQRPDAAVQEMSLSASARAAAFTPERFKAAAAEFLASLQPALAPA